MSILNSMKQKLHPLGIYSLSDTSKITAELTAYSEALDEIEAQLQELEQERFLATAKTYGITMRELTIGPEQKYEKLEKRRNTLLHRWAISETDFNKKAIESLLKTEGINGYIIEVPEKNTIYINCLSLDVRRSNKDAKKEAISQFLPAHLECVFDFRNLQWQVIDAKNYTFDGMDARNLTWDDIANYKEII